jgi:hypothetical protein
MYSFCRTRTGGIGFVGLENVKCLLHLAFSLFKDKSSYDIFLDFARVVLQGKILVTYLC